MKYVEIERLKKNTVINVYNVDTLDAGILRPGSSGGTVQYPFYLSIKIKISVFKWRKLDLYGYVKNAGKSVDEILAHPLQMPLHVSWYARHDGRHVSELLRLENASYSEHGSDDAVDDADVSKWFFKELSNVMAAKRAEEIEDQCRRPVKMTSVQYELHRLKDGERRHDSYDSDI